MSGRRRTILTLTIGMIGIFGSAGLALSDMGGHPAAGLYQCLGGPSGNIRISFDGNGGYTAESGNSGSYSLDENGNIVFAEGPWGGFFARRLRENSVGLTSDLGRNFFEMTCDLQ